MLRVIYYPPRASTIPSEAPGVTVAVATPLDVVISQAVPLLDAKLIIVAPVPTKVPSEETPIAAVIAVVTPVAPEISP